jgi:hypothetical protein
MVRFLELVTTLFLAAVAVSLLWMVAASFVPTAFRWSTEESEVIFIIALLAATLTLVSAVALWHTRPRDLP